MSNNFDPLMDALTCLSSENVKPCRMEMCPYFDTYNPNADWPCDIPEIAKAARARIHNTEIQLNDGRGRIVFVPDDVKVITIPVGSKVSIDKPTNS